MPHSCGILVFPDVQQLDLTGPYEVFASAEGTEVHLIWKDLQPVLASTRLSLTPTTTFAECPPLDVLCIPGGSGINALLLDEMVLAFVRQRAAKARYITSVCTGALVLGAGLLKGKRATTPLECARFPASLWRHACRGACRSGWQSDHRRRCNLGHRFRIVRDCCAFRTNRSRNNPARTGINSCTAIFFRHAKGSITESVGGYQAPSCCIARRAREDIVSIVGRYLNAKLSTCCAENAGVGHRRHAFSIPRPDRN